MSFRLFQIRILSFIPASGMAVYPFILLKKKEYKTDEVLVNHERIHLRQQLEMLIIPFYIAYFFNYILNRAKGLHHENAYREIIFEREAFKCQYDLDYLTNRAFWAFLKH